MHLCVLSYLRLPRMAGYIYTLGVPTNLANAQWPDCTDSYIIHWRPNSATQSTEEDSVIFELAWAWESLVNKIPRACCRPCKPVARIQSWVLPVVLWNLGLIVDLKKHLRCANILEIMQREALCAAVCIIKRHMTTWTQSEKCLGHCIYYCLMYTYVPLICSSSTSPEEMRSLKIKCREQCNLYWQSISWTLQPLWGLNWILLPLQGL